MKSFILGLLILSTAAYAEEEICLEEKSNIDELVDSVDCKNLDRGLSSPGNVYLYQGLARGKSALDNCFESENKLHPGKVMPKTATKYFEHTEIDCAKELENLKSVLAKGEILLASPHQDLKSMENEIPALDEKNSNLKQLYAKVTSSCSSGESQNCLNAKTSYKNMANFYKYQAVSHSKHKSPKDVKKSFSEISSAFCFNSLEKKKLDEASMGDCKEELAALEVSAPTLDCKSKISGVNVIQQLEKVTRAKKGELSCSQKAEQIKTLFKNARVSNLDDMAVLTVMAKNIKQIIKDPKKRQIIGGALDAGRPIPLGASEDVSLSFQKLDDTSAQSHFNSAVIDLRMAMIGLQNKAMKEAGTKRYADFCQSPAKDKILKDVVNGLTLALNDPARIKAESREFSAKCDKKIATIFGNEETVASTCGHDHVGKSGGQDRSHTFINAHFYPNKKGKGTGPLYAPKGMTSQKLIPGMASQGCYKLIYANGIGDLKGNYTIDFCHTGNPSTGKSISSLPKNERGSTLIGTLAGVGGASKAEDYNHSHLQLRTGAGRVNFVDAFCRNTED